MHFEKIAINPLLGKKTWDFADMAVAQDWELERGNEGALTWTDLGPEMARVLCENPEVLAVLVGFVVEPRARAWAGAGAWARAGARAWAGAWAWAGAGAWARAWAWAGAGAWARAGAEAGKRTLAWALAWEEARSGAGALAKAGENSA
jgi:hypothetical protein